MKNLSFLFILLSLSACLPMQQVTVTNLHDLASYPENCSVFSLPRTRINLEFTAVRHRSIPGPYQRYAYDMLGIDGTPDLSETRWELLHLSTTGELIPDPDYYFTLAFSGRRANSSCLEDLFAKQLIVDPANYSPFFGSTNIDGEVPEPVHFTDLTIKPNFEKELATHIKRPLVPTDLTDEVPVGNKTLRTKAEEAAAFIIKTRKRRFKLLAGQYEVFPEGTALETAVRELTDLENEYLALFIGKSYTDTLSYSYQYTPTTGTEPERAILCRFSEETGFTNAESSTGKPIVLDIQNSKHTAILKEVQIPREGSSYQNTVLYRIPERAMAKVIYGSSILQQTEFMIYQYGAFVPATVY